MAQARNANAVRSDRATTGADGDDATWMSFWTERVGGTFLFAIEISTNPDALVLGAAYEIEAGGIVINRATGTNETEASARRGLRGMVAGGLWGEFHTGPPGASAVANRIPEIARVNIPENQWTIV